MCDKLVYFSVLSYCKLIILVVLDFSLWFLKCYMVLWEHVYTFFTWHYICNLNLNYKNVIMQITAATVS